MLEFQEASIITRLFLLRCTILDSKYWLPFKFHLSTVGSYYLDGFQEKQQRSRARLSRVERGDGSLWLSNSRIRDDKDTAPTSQNVCSEESCEVIANQLEGIECQSTLGPKCNLKTSRNMRSRPQKAAEGSEVQDFSVKEENSGEKAVPREPAKVRQGVLSVRPWKEGEGGRVPVWDTRTQRILWGNCAPLAKNIGKYLESHPSMKVWAGEGRQRFAVESVAEVALLDSTSVEFQAREFLGSDAEESSPSIPASPSKDLENEAVSLGEAVRVRIITSKKENSLPERAFETEKDISGDISNKSAVVRVSASQSVDNHQVNQCLSPPFIVEGEGNIETSKACAIPTCSIEEVQIRHSSFLTADSTAGFEPRVVLNAAPCDVAGLEPTAMSTSSHLYYAKLETCPDTDSAAAARDNELSEPAHIDVDGQSTAAWKSDGASNEDSGNALAAAVAGESKWCS